MQRIPVCITILPSSSHRLAKMLLKLLRGLLNVSSFIFQVYTSPSNRKNVILKLILSVFLCAIITLTYIGIKYLKENVQPGDVLFLIFVCGTLFYYWFTRPSHNRRYYQRNHHRHQYYR
ncbi:unnamed protein product [Nezara viridula]|uniref:Uncharacterized protein n=1 Tax=Nezara viridula TaxID=85310 RepID=A0A9P0H3T7_NEZVI|nr:unnamed protein product [Nezara viridula]